MSRYIWLAVVFALALASCPAGGTSGKNATGKFPTVGNADSKPVETPASQDTPVQAEASSPIERGYDIFHTTEYSNTSLACAHCHADSERTSGERIYIASSGHGAASRGAWKITSQAMLDAGEGHAKTLIDAANFCVKAPYMNHGEQLIEGSDAEALVAYLESIATDDEPFIISTANKMPVGGLLFDEDNGHRVYSQSCRNCHDTGLEGVPELSGANEWLNALQVMAKVRKIGDDYYSDWENMNYEDFAKGEEIALPGQANPCGENPCGDNPCGEDYHDSDGDHGMFAEGAMPFYSTDVLSDQDVVDIGYFLATIL